MTGGTPEPFRNDGNVKRISFLRVHKAKVLLSLQIRLVHLSHSLRAVRERSRDHRPHAWDLQLVAAHTVVTCKQLRVRALGPSCQSCPPSGRITVRTAGWCCSS
eukprot:Skav205007  [mRNA]  locus=scaffold2134:39901:40212:+ [translate_table: standard]